MTAPRSKNAFLGPRRRRTMDAKAESESGITVSEVLVALMLSAVVMLPLLAVLRSSLNSERNQGSRADRHTEVWQAAERLSQDIRIGTLAPELSVRGSYGQTLPLLTIDERGKKTLVEWSVTSAGLVRSTSQAVLGAKKTSIALVTDAVVEPDRPTFAYLTKSGIALDVKTDPAKLAACTARIDIAIHMPASGYAADNEFDVNESSASFRVLQDDKPC